MCSFGSCQTRFEFLSQFRKVRNALECLVTQVQTHLPKTKRVWPMKIKVICTVHVHISLANEYHLVGTFHLLSGLFTNIYYLAPGGGGRGIVMPMSVCLSVCPCFRKISKCNISAISQPIIMKLGIHITYGYTVTDKYFQNFRSKVKVVGRRKVKNVIWPYLGNEWS